MTFFKIFYEILRLKPIFHANLQQPISRDNMQIATSSNLRILSEPSQNLSGISKNFDIWKSYQT